MDNLARDVALAEKLGYGCHYGRFKAVYPNTMDKSIEEILVEAELLRLRGEIDVSAKKTVVLLEREDPEKENALREEGILVYIRR